MTTIDFLDRRQAVKDLLELGFLKSDYRKAKLTLEKQKARKAKKVKK